MEELKHLSTDELHDLVADKYDALIEADDDALENQLDYEIDMIEQEIELREKYETED